MEPSVLRQELKELVIRELNLEGKSPSDLDESAPLFGDGLGLDSLDALQLAMAIEERYRVRLPQGEAVRSVFASIATLADYIAKEPSAA